MITMKNGLKYEELRVGTGEEIQSDDQYKVIIHHTSWRDDGSKYDSSYDRDKPFQFRIGLGQVIKGWDEGMIGMKVGGIRKLYVPSDLAYGSRGAGSIILPNTNLIFQIEYLGHQ